MAAWQPSGRRAGFWQRQRGLGRKLVPAAVWTGAVIALLYLATVTPSAHRLTALADTASTTVWAPVSGRIVTVAVQLHQLVEADQVIARLDDRDVLLRLSKTNDELARLRADLARDASATTTEHERLLHTLETAQLDAVATHAEIAAARIRMQGAAIAADRLGTLASQGLGGGQELARMQTERDALKQRSTELQTLHEERRKHIAAAQRRVDDSATTAPRQAPDAAADARRWQLQAHEAEIERIALDARALDLRSAFRGHVANLGAHAGEWVNAGHAVAAVVDPTPRRIVAWVPDDQRARFADVRRLHVRRADASDLGAASVVSISPAVVRVPSRLWRDPQREEWGYEVIVTATGAELPGERLLLTPER
jgi:multidrug resistance efflux pump